MEFDITKMVEKIAMQAKENQEEFIFETIRPYCEDVLQMKINKKELKQILLNGMQKQQPCEDCISRDEALKVMCDNCPMYNCVTGCSSYRHIEKMPSVTPKFTDEEIDRAQAVEQAYVDKMVELAVEETKRPKGKWIRRDGSRALRCSECFYYISEEIPYTFNYCPMCGADMRGEEE